MCCEKPCFYPVFLFLFLLVSFIITYSIAVSCGHVEPILPYISDTGILPPENSVFGQLLNIGAIFAAFTIYIRYKQIYLHCKGSVELRRVVIVNKVAFVMGLLIAFGLSIVGNFQANHVGWMHAIGAILAFLVGCVYCNVQTWISYKLPDMPRTSKFTRILRLILCIADTILMIIFFVSYKLAFNYSPPDSMKWGQSDPGYAVHLTAAIAEWLMTIVTLLYFLTFTKEFTKLKLNSPVRNFENKKRETVSTDTTTADITTVSARV